MFVAGILYSSRIFSGRNVVSMIVSCSLFIMNAKVAKPVDSSDKPPVTDPLKMLVVQLAGMPTLLLVAAEKKNAFYRWRGST